MKLPHIQFYTGDWLKDPNLSLCAPASRGIWIDLICRMHELDRSGELRGTTDQLARLARCSAVELVAALTDLQITRAAVVGQRNGTWVIANLRMQREALRRAQRAKAGSIGGSKTQANREQNPDIDNDNGLQRVREFSKGEGIAESDADWFYWKGKGNGWTNGGEPIRDWKATLRSWNRAGYLPSQKSALAARAAPRKFPARTDPPRPQPKRLPTRILTDEEWAAHRTIAKTEVVKLRGILCTGAGPVGLSEVVADLKKEESPPAPSEPEKQEEIPF